MYGNFSSFKYIIFLKKNLVKFSKGWVNNVKEILSKEVAAVGVWGCNIPNSLDLRKFR